MPVENGNTEEGVEEEEEEEVIEVPKEIEVEEIVERDSFEDVMETRKIPQVKAMYAYRGQGMKVDKGEVSTVYQFLFSLI